MAAIQWPSFTGTAALAGVSSGRGVAVYYDASLPAAKQCAVELLADADRIMAVNDAIFGAASAPVNVILFAMGGATDGTGGADHMSCDFVNGGNIEVCVAENNPMRVSALFEAELSECSMGGNLCGCSTGEALSRWCAASVSNNALADFATAPTWFADGKADWVNKTDPTDQNADSTGCGMAFISWLLSKGHKLSEIAQAMVKLGTGGTFAGLYYGLLGPRPRAAWSDFLAALPAPVTSDDPFSASAIKSAPAIKSHRLRKS